MATEKSEALLEMRGASSEVRCGKNVGLAGAGRTETAPVVFDLAAHGSGAVEILRRKVERPAPPSAVDMRVGFAPEDRSGHHLAPQWHQLGRELVTLATLPGWYLGRLGAVA